MVQCHHRLPCWLWCASLYQFVVDHLSNAACNNSPTAVYAMSVACPCMIGSRCMAFYQDVQLLCPITVLNWEWKKSKTRPPSNLGSFTLIATVFTPSMSCLNFNFHWFCFELLICLLPESLSPVCLVVFLVSRSGATGQQRHGRLLPAWWWFLQTWSEQTELHTW
jgi:hypothetical protein